MPWKKSFTALSAMASSSRSRFFFRSPRWRPLAVGRARTRRRPLAAGRARTRFKMTQLSSMSTNATTSGFSSVPGP